MTTHIRRIQAPPLALALYWDNGRLAAVDLDFADPDAAPEPPTDNLHRLLARELARYAASHPPGWPDLPLDFGRLPPFRARVLETLHTRVGFGETVTYGELAAMCGRPGAARAVGGAMAANPWPLLVPCHRVLAAGGRLGGFSGAGLSMKRLLLSLEAGETGPSPVPGTLPYQVPAP